MQRERSESRVWIVSMHRETDQWRTAAPVDDQWRTQWTASPVGSLSRHLGSKLKLTPSCSASSKETGAWAETPLNHSRGQCLRASLREGPHRPHPSCDHKEVEGTRIKYRRMRRSESVRVIRDSVGEQASKSQVESDCAFDSFIDEPVRFTGPHIIGGHANQNIFH
jgi:hypothetical protein